MLLSDKVCIITGAASPRGIGRATARLFAGQGARVVILDLDEGQAREAAADLGQGHLGLACNVTDKQACLAAASIGSASPTTSATPACSSRRTCRPTSRAPRST
jgi:NAD(P)-dependent dehydrogenase (short-subunit alcohol dehydrogenase family)